jgi:hypothetical protein
MAYIPTADNLGSMFVGDRPDTPSTIFFHDELGNPAATNHFNTLATTLYSPAGVSLGTLTTTVHDGHGVHIAWGTTSLFTVPGVYSLRCKFTVTNDQLVTAEPLQIVIQAIDGWLTLEMARAQWADAPLDDVFLAQILDAAKLQCIAYAPALAAGAVVPVNYLHAQLMQARALYQSVIANQQDNVGVDGFQVRVFPLDFTIRALLRPKRAIGGMY